MAVGKIHKLKSAVFTPQGGSPITIKGCKTLQETPNANLVKLRADGAIGTTKAFQEGHDMSLTITLESNENRADFSRGMIGTLVCTTFEQAEGVGSTGSDTVMTFPAATAAADSHAQVVGFGNGYPLDGAPTSTIEFLVYESTGDITKLRSIA